MQLTKIQAANFGPYGTVDIDLTTTSLCIVTGPNGAGKSTLFTDIPRFALFGSSRTGSVDDLVRKGTQQMSVTLEFIFAGAEYRIVRSRSTKGRGKSILEFYVRKGGEWQSLTADNLRATESRIAETLKISEETFTASCMILQGRSNEFTRKTAAERKAVLFQILNLSLYEKLKEKAHEQSRMLLGEVKAVKERLADIERRIQESAGVEDEIAATKTRIAALSAQLRSDEKTLAELREKLAQAEAQELHFQELQSQCRMLQTEITDLKVAIEGAERKFQTARETLDHEAEINARVAEYEAAREKVASLKAKVPQLTSLEEDGRRLFSDLRRLREQQDALQKRIKVLEADVAELNALAGAQERYEEARRRVQAMDETASRVDELWEKIRAAEAEVASLDGIIAEKTRDLRAAEKKAEMLTNSGCIDPARARCRFLADAQQAKAKIPELQEELQRLGQDRVPLEQEIRRLKSEMESLGYDRREHAASKDELEQWRLKVEKATRLEGQATVLANTREQLEQSFEREKELAARLSDVQAASKILAAELEPLPQLQAGLDAYAPWLKAKEMLAVARQTVEEEPARIFTLKEQLAAKQARLDDVDAAIKKIDRSSLGPLGLTLDIDAMEEHVAETRDRLGNMQRALGRLEQDKQAKEKLADETITLNEKLSDLTRRQYRYAVLDKAFGRDGIPALIVENAIPELEHIANGILGRMTNGAMSLRFETQKELKTVKGALAETLEIIVSTLAGERPYESFSGGEQFRIDFAIRVALSKLLARRAGAPLRLLVLDEGIGSQDAEGRERLVEAIAAIQSEFAQVYVVSHIEELQAAFPQRVVVVPGANGSSVQLI